MGDRIVIRFTNQKSGEPPSVDLYAHWAGEHLLDAAVHYAHELAREVRDNQRRGPLDRLEPDAVMVDFIRWLHSDAPLKRSRDFRLADSGAYSEARLDNGIQEIDLAAIAEIA